MILRLVVALLTLFVTGSAYASTAGSLPWDAPLQTLTNNLTGPVATSLSIGGMFAAGGVLIFGGELGSFVATCLRVVVTTALLVFGARFLSAFGLTGAIVP